LSAELKEELKRKIMARVDVGHYIKRYLDTNPDLEINIAEGDEGQVQAIELELHLLKTLKNLKNPYTEFSKKSYYKFRFR